jgi:hypothetical protein
MTFETDTNTVPARRTLALLSNKVPVRGLYSGLLME